MKKEIRKLAGELRAAGDGKTIVGTIPYDSPADLGGFVETLLPGCFDDSLSSGKRIVALWSHDDSKPLGNTFTGTLQTENRADALHVRITPAPETSWGKDALQAAKRGDLGGFSFGFTVPAGGDYWEGDYRYIRIANLIEVSPVIWPAYEKSTITVRGINMNYDDQTINMPQPVDGAPQLRSGGDLNNNFSRADVQDQPIYRGRFALGQQMMDIAALGGAPVPFSVSEARSRWEQMVKREETRAAGTGQVQAVGKDGGFLLQGETSYEMMTNGINNSVVLSRAANRNIGNHQFVEVVGINETSRADGSRGGGIRVYTDAELAQMTSSKTEFKKIRLEPKRLTGLYYASDEILDNAPMLQAEMSELFTEEFSFKGQDLVINGSGVGEPLGILNAACLVTQAKETGQAANTIVHDNATKTLTRALIRNQQSVIWLANRNLLPDLLKLSVPVGTGGSLAPIFKLSNDATSGVAGTLLGFPLTFVEQCADLGDKGDLILADMSSYYVANKGGIQAASSIHLKFDYNQTAFRFVYFMDGQPRLSSAITPYKGSTTVSPFVTLAARA